MIKKIGLIIVALVVLFVIVVALQPTEFRISRSAAIAAPISVVFEQVNDLHKWQTWSPWARLDPNAQAVFEGPIAGEGASFKWIGNDKVGEGIMTIVESRSNELVKFKLEFLKPFATTNTSEFTFKSKGNQTTVTWSMSGKSGFMGKAMSLIMNCDKMVGAQFEQGFANLKAIVEK